MREQYLYQYRSIAAVLALLAALVAGCGASQPTPTPEVAAGDETYVSANLDASYESALGVSAQLALGILRLEETANAVTVGQAGTLLPLWQALRGGSLQSEEETDAVLKQIENAMSGEQLEAIAAMRLTLDDLRAWAEGQGLTLQAGEGQGPLGQGGQLSPEARATRQAQSGGQGPDPEAVGTMRAQFENISDEQREAMRATAQAGGGMPGFRGGARGFDGGQPMTRIVLGPLVDLLTARAAE
jgi:hypothetical protein